MQNTGERVHRMECCRLFKPSRSRRQPLRIVARSLLAVDKTCSTQCPLVKCPLKGNLWTLRWRLSARPSLRANSRRPTTVCLQPIGMWQVSKIGNRWCLQGQATVQSKCLKTPLPRHLRSISLTWFKKSHNQQERRSSTSNVARFTSQKTRKLMVHSVSRIDRRQLCQLRQPRIAL